MVGRGARHAQRWAAPAFPVPEDPSGRIQIFAQKEEMGDAFSAYLPLDLGDFASATGVAFRTAPEKIGNAPRHQQARSVRRLTSTTASRTTSYARDTASSTCWPTPRCASCSPSGRCSSGTCVTS
ncbi:MAG: hypothetical protein U0514_01695 [Candidatus Andersenbacteria bacterium]